MDSSASSSSDEKAPPPNGSVASPEASVEVEQQEKHPVPPLPAGVPSDAAVKVESGGEEDDEKVEKFFALLANIRALRAMYRAANGGGSGVDCGGSPGAAGRGRKRAREAEQPWKPAFRMEDFEQEEQQPAGKEKMMESLGCARPPAETSTSGAVADGDEDDGEVVEPRGM
ncbi:hypothetical protein EJB05_35180, partial [Eragrostis curvula]